MHMCVVFYIYILRLQVVETSSSPHLRELTSTILQKDGYHFHLCALLN